MKTNKLNWILIAGLLLLPSMGFAEGETSVGAKIAMIDAGKWKTPKTVDIRRCEYLVEQLAARYSVTEIQVADAMVFLTHTLLKEKRGIEQTVRETLEAIFGAAKIKDGKEGLDLVSALYVTWRDQNP